MSEQSTPDSTSTANEEKPTPTLSEVVRKYNTEQLIDFLRDYGDLRLSDAHFKILRNEEITGYVLSMQEFSDVGFKAGACDTSCGFPEVLFIV